MTNLVIQLGRCTRRPPANFLIAPAVRQSEKLFIVLRELGIKQLELAAIGDVAGNQLALKYRLGEANAMGEDVLNIVPSLCKSAGHHGGPVALRRVFLCAHEYKAVSLGHAVHQLPRPAQERC